MRRVEQLITQVRSQTENQQVGATDGISDEEFIQFLNDGQEHLLSKIFQTNARAFSKSKYIDVVSGTNRYALPSDTFLDSRVVMVEYSPTGLEKDYKRLDKGIAAERNHYPGYPSHYDIMGGELVISSNPQRSVTSGIKLTYDPIFPRLDKRRTTVSAVTTADGVVTALTLATGSPFTAADYDLFDYISVIGPTGTVLCQGIRHEGVNSSTGVVSLPSGGHTLLTGEAVTVGDHVVLGEYSSSHPRLPNVCEKYLISYAAMRVFARDSSTDVSEAIAFLSSMEETIIANYQESTGDIDDIPVIDYDYYPEC